LNFENLYGDFQIFGQFQNEYFILNFGKILEIFQNIEF